MLYHQLQYSGWSDANHVKDLIRPLFIFVVGVAMPYSFGKRLSLGDSKRKVFGHVLTRAAILFLLGTIAGGHLLALDRSKFDLVNNVLEEIAIGYLVASLFLLNFSVRGQLIALAAMLLFAWLSFWRQPAETAQAGPANQDGPTQAGGAASLDVLFEGAKTRDDFELLCEFVGQGTLDVSVWRKNLADEDGIRWANNLTETGLKIGVARYLDPRTYGVDFIYNL